MDILFIKKTKPNNKYVGNELVRVKISFEMKFFPFFPARLSLQHAIAIPVSFLGYHRRRPSRVLPQYKENKITHLNPGNYESQVSPSPLELRRGRVSSSCTHVFCCWTFWVFSSGWLRLWRWTHATTDGRDDWLGRARTDSEDFIKITICQKKAESTLFQRPQRWSNINLDNSDPRRNGGREAEFRNRVVVRIAAGLSSIVIGLN